MAASCHLNASLLGAGELVCGGVGKCLAATEGLLPSSEANASIQLGLCQCPFFYDAAYSCAKTFFFTYDIAAVILHSVRPLFFTTEAHKISSPPARSGDQTRPA